MYWILTHFVVVSGFGVLSVGASVGVHIFLRRKFGRGLPRLTWVTLLATIAMTMSLAYLAGEAERDRLVAAVSALAPTYASELHHEGLEQITARTTADGERYLTLIGRQLEWLKLNPGIADIYTYGRNDNGDIVLLVDSETDYDHDGRIDGEREQRTEIGESYDDQDGVIAAAFAGRGSFQAEPVTDRWGTWVTATEPVCDASGKVYAVLGVDFPAEQWVARILMMRASILALGSVVVGVQLIFSTLTQRLHAEIARRKATEAVKDELQAKLVEASRQAGMAEVATGVLHNIGNVLNSVNVSTRLMSDKLRTTRLPGLKKSIGLLRENEGDLPRFFTADPRAAKLPDYLAKLATLLEQEHHDLTIELGQLSAGVEHISEVVRMQQNCATESTLVTPCLPRQIMDEALRVNLLAMERHKIAVVEDYELIDSRLLDKHKLLQILVNFINNAKKATGSSSTDNRRMTLGIRLTDEGKSVEFSVADNGEGIAKENLDKIFRHGFTTRSDGHGFGLHSAANAASEMGGTIRVQSDGVGTGATFSVTVPAAPVADASTTSTRAAA